MKEQKRDNRINDSRAEWTLVAIALTIPLVSLLSISI